MPEEDRSWAHLLSGLDLDAVELTEAGLAGSLLQPNSAAESVFLIQRKHLLWQFPRPTHSSGFLFILHITNIPHPRFPHRFLPF